MGHYVLALDDRQTRFGLYSTVVDGLIWEATDAATMRRWLEEEGYDTWLQKGFTPKKELVERYGADTGQRIWEGQERDMHRFLWHKEGFHYALAADAWFCLPMSMWNH